MARVTVTEFTDPFCTWCWGAEPLVRRLKEVYRDQLHLEYVMGGLVEDFAEFSDPASAEEWSEEVAPHWSTAADSHGMPVDLSLWREDPPESSYPACVAYEAAAFQDRELAHRFLRRMREAAQAEGRNVADREVQVALAETVGLDLEDFRARLDNGEAREAFESDLARTREHTAASLPAFKVGIDGETELLRGFTPFATFEKLFTEAGVDLTRHEPRPLAEFVEHYDRVAAQEVAAVYELQREEAVSRLRDLEGVRAVEAGDGHLWEPV